MQTETVTFADGTYDKQCPEFKDIKIGSTPCIGHPDIPTIKACKFCVSYKSENTYYLSILKETIPITSEVMCSRQNYQLKLF